MCQVNHCYPPNVSRHHRITHLTKGDDTCTIARWPVFYVIKYIYLTYIHT